MVFRTALTSTGLVVLFFTVVACKSTAPIAQPLPPPPPPVASTETPAHDNFNAVLWVQTSAEYQALTQQAYMAAQLALDEALDDPTWTASVEQERLGDFADLPPAVVLDVDETVLDNSAYQARLIRDNARYASSSWAAWAEEAAATEVAGALAYTKEAAERGVTVVYITNRKAAEERATRKNLSALGFPLAEGEDIVLTRSERPEWTSSDKTPRREDIARRYRIVQLVGDNLGDFIEAEGTPAERKAAVTRYADYWGLRWIMLPNPTYGNWEGALFGRDYKKPAAQQRSDKTLGLRY